MSKLSPSAPASKSKCAAPALLTEQLARAREQFAKLKDNDKENALRGVFLGGLFWQIKEAAGHGNFERVASAQMAEIPKRTRVELMRLWKAFTGGIKLLNGKPIEIPDAQLALAKPEGPVIEAALKFVGDLSLHALMIEHGVRDTKKLGGARTKGAGGETQALDAEQLYLFARDEIGGILTAAEQLFLKDNKLLHLSGHPEEIRGVVEGFRSLADKLKKAAKDMLKTK